MNDFLNNLIEKFASRNRENVYISVTPNAGLEVIQVDPIVKAVKNYGYRPLEYNEGMREIANYDDFKTKLGELFAELNIKPNCNVILSLPTVHFGKIELPVLLNDEGINEAVISEVERSYIFKRCEPTVSWFEVPAKEDAEIRTIIYSAVQKQVIITIKSILTDFGATLAGLEPSLMTNLEALAFTNLAEANMNSEKKWSLLLVNSNGYSILSLEGKNIIDYYDEPLPLRTYEIEEIYDVISASLKMSLSNFTTEDLYIISETDLVSAEHLASTIDGNYKISFLENNAFKRNEFLQATLNVLTESVLKISLEAIGIAVSKISDIYPVKIDFSGSKVAIKTSEESYTFIFKDREFILTETIFKKILVILGLVLLVPTLAMLLISPLVKKNKQVALDSVKTELADVETRIEKLEGAAAKSKTFVVKKEIEKVVMANRTKLIAYSALGESVPPSLWITSFNAKDDGRFDIKGLSDNVKDIYLFFSNLKYSLVNSQIRLHKLEMQADTIEDAISSNNNMIYNFEITNMSALEFMSKEDAAGIDKNSKATDEKANKQGKSDNSGEPDKSGAADNGKAKPVSELEPVDIGK